MFKVGDRVIVRHGDALDALGSKVCTVSDVDWGDELYPYLVSNMDGVRYWAGFGEVFAVIMENE